jgi:hypothetical protein
MPLNHNPIYPLPQLQKRLPSKTIGISNQDHKRRDDGAQAFHFQRAREKSSRSRRSTATKSRVNS